LLRASTDNAENGFPGVSGSLFDRIRARTAEEQHKKQAQQQQSSSSSLPPPPPPSQEALATSGQSSQQQQQVQMQQQQHYGVVEPAATSTTTDPGRGQDREGHCNLTFFLKRRRQCLRGSLRGRQLDREWVR
jgi:hypothetical protein